MYRSINAAVLRLAAVFVLFPFGAASVQAAQQQRLTLATSDGPREYVLATPDAGLAGPRPLVLLLHGHAGTADNVMGAGRAPSPLSAWLAIADRERLLVAALQGANGADGLSGWNDCRRDATGNPAVDDVAFATRLVRQLVQQGKADAKRIYVMGMSNGGMMSLRLALQMQPVPAAVAAVAASMAEDSECAGTAPRVSVLLIDGTEDPIVPFLGGQVAFEDRPTGAVIGGDATRDFWLRNNGLDSTPVSQLTLPHLSLFDATRATRTLYGADQGPQVSSITITRGGHVEPSLQFTYKYLYRRLVGRQNRDMESAEEAWAFFKTKTAP